MTAPGRVHTGHAHSASDGHGHAHPAMGHGTNGIRRIFDSVFGHSHDAADKVDHALESSERGIWAVKVSLVGLGLTALLQVVVVAISGSVALLADTIHNFSDALTAVPLWIAFALGRRAASRRYTYGYGRAEDIAGVFIVGMIALSAAIAGWESVRRLVDPQPIQHIGWVIAASLVGFAGNEAVAMFRIRTGKEIGSAALVADGYHARTDGFTSLAVLFGALGVLAGYPIADPLVGLGITAAILFVLRDAARHIWHRLMDAISPEIVDRLEAAAHLYGVREVRNLRVRWLGHKLEAELQIVVRGDLPTRSSHGIAEAVRHALLHAEPKLVAVAVHVDPADDEGQDGHAQTAHHAVKERTGSRNTGGTTSEH